MRAAAERRFVRLKTPISVTRIEKSISLGGREVAVEMLLPNTSRRVPVVVVAHGFTRSRLNMVGWGTLLASNGFLAAVPDLPAWADPERNSRALAELLELMLQRKLVTTLKVMDQGALIGFSMGGLCTMLAAGANPNAGCWIGLDPVHGGKDTLAVASRLTIPAVVLMAEAGACNANGCARDVVEALRGPMLSLRVKDATHCDCENPTDWTAEMVCGKADPARRAIFETYTLAALKTVFFRYEDTAQQLLEATNAPGVKEVHLRNIAEFSKHAPAAR